MNVDQKLDDIALKQIIWKNHKLLTSCLLIAHKALEKEVFYPDAIAFDFLLTDEDRNVIGSAWRICSKTLGIIEKTGNFRRSKTEGSNGRTIFEYKILDRPIARALLKRYDLKKYESLQHPQLSLGL
jgi:hypothetical protein